MLNLGHNCLKRPLISSVKTLGSEIVLFGSLDNLVAMLVCSGQKQGLFALDLVESCRRIVPGWWNRHAPDGDWH